MGDNKRYNDYMRYYSHTSEARKLSHADEPKHKVKKVRKVRRPKTVLKYIRDNKINLSLYAVVSIIIFFSGVFSTVAFSAKISSGNADVVSLTKELKKQKEAYQLIQAEITSSYDLKQIEQIAINKLGMNRPRTDQIVHITVPKQSYIVQYKPEETLQENVWGLSYLFGLVKRTLGI